MADFVIDASIAAAWFLPDEQNRAADNVLARLAQDDAFVPGIWHFEVRNLIVMAERRSRLTQLMATDALNLIQACPVTTDDRADLIECMKLAHAFQLTFYDALYLELAMRRKFQLRLQTKP